MAVVTLLYDETTEHIPVAIGTKLMPVLQKAGALAFPCAGNHRCGKCRVYASGKVSAMTPSERELLGDVDRAMRLACFLTVQGDCVITVPSADHTQVLTDGVTQCKAFDPIYSGYAAAFDIGTTTVAGSLFSDTHRYPIGTIGAPNRQRPFGADVISRIASCADGNMAALRNTIRAQLSDLLMQLCQNANVAPQQVRTISMTGNTVMLHLLAGLDPQGMAAVPFKPVSLFGDWQDWKLDGFTQARIYLPPCISAFVGADLTCSILAAGIADSNQTTLLMDIGTNGELVLFDGKTFVCCSTAAGPALEGAGISCGSSAVDGAVCAVTTDMQTVHYEVIGGGAPRSLCGSGLLDAAAVFLNLGLLDLSGKIALERPLRIGDSNLELTQQDIRQLQLAKSAITAGIETLLKECHLDEHKVAHVLLCGGFGNVLNIRSAQEIGLLSAPLAAKAQTLGNAAGAGAGLLLQSKSAFQTVQELPKRAKTIDLSVNAFFMERFVEHMGF